MYQSVTAAQWFSHLRPVSMSVKRSSDSWGGHTVIRRTDFGIKPISIGGGTIKIRHAVGIDFAAFTAAR